MNLICPVRGSWEGVEHVNNLQTDKRTSVLMSLQEFYELVQKILAHSVIIKACDLGEKTFRVNCFSRLVYFELEFAYLKKEKLTN